MEKTTESKVNKEQQLHLRLSADESAIVRQKAQDAGLNISEYVRRAALGGTVHAQLSPTDLDNLRKIGINLNQVTRWANTHQQWPVEIERLISQLKTILTA